MQTRLRVAPDTLQAAMKGGAGAASATARYFAILILQSLMIAKLPN